MKFTKKTNKTIYSKIYQKIYKKMNQTHRPLFLMMNMTINSNKNMIFSQLQKIKMLKSYN